ncbi:MAG: YnbE family lipoprotein [Pseudomonadota bacterium]
MHSTQMVSAQVLKHSAIRAPAFAGLLVALSLSACTPRVIVEAPSDPITINLNVKIDQEVRVKLDKEVEDLIAENPDLF